MSLFILLESAEAAEIPVHCVICQLSQSPALNGWESRAGISDPVPGCSGEGRVGFGHLGMTWGSGNCLLCVWPILAVPTSPCQVLDVWEENGRKISQDSSLREAETLSRTGKC